MGERTVDVEALMLEQRKSWEAQAPIRIEELRQRHPVLCDQKEALLDLINHEIVLRAEYEAPPGRGEYFQRFPELQADLALLFDVQEAIDGESVGEHNAATFIAPAAAPANAVTPRPSGNRPSPPSIWQRCGRFIVIAFIVACLGCSAWFAYLWQTAVGQRDLARAELYDTRIQLARRYWHENECERMHALLASLRPAPGELDRRGPEWHDLWNLVHPAVVAPAERCVAYHPDGSLLAAGFNNSIYLWRSADLEKEGEHKPAWILDGHAGNVVSVSFSRNGDRLLSAADDRTLRLWDVQRKSLLRIVPAHPKQITRVCFVSGDDDLLASACQDGQIRLWKTDGSLHAVLEEHKGPVNDIACSADGKRIVSAGDDHYVIIWDVATGKPIRKLNGNGPIRCVAVAGDRIASAGMDGALCLWDLATGKLLHVNTHRTAQVNRLAFRSDGKRLAAACGDRIVRIWDTDKDISDTPVLMFRGHFDAVAGLSYSPSGERLVSVPASAKRDHTLRFWDANTPQKSPGN
jgi:hypothetical protein